MTKFIEVKYKGHCTLVNIDNIAYVEPSRNGDIVTSIKLNCKTTPTGGQMMLGEPSVILTLGGGDIQYLYEVEK